MRYIARFNPLQEIANFQNAFDRAFDLRWPTAPAHAQSAPRFRLPLDVFERDDAYLIVAALPGVAAEDIHIQLEDDVLQISAAFPKFDAGEQAKTIWRERRHGQFQRQLRLPIPVNRRGNQRRVRRRPAAPDPAENDRDPRAPDPRP